jgi:trigger factor
MNITLHKHNNTLATLKIQLLEEDYQPSVDKKLKDYRKKANMKGFRPGMVPLDLIKKMYGNSILVDEVNHKLGHLVNDYIKDNKLQIVGDPMPVRNEEAINWDIQKTFDFTYELGLSGDFTVDFSKIAPIDSYEIKAGQKELDETIDKLKEQFGEQIKAESVLDGDMVFGTFIMGDWTEKSAIPMRAINENVKSLFVGSKIGDAVIFDIQNTFVDLKSLSLATGKKEEEVALLEGNCQFEIEDITRQGQAEMNETFYDKVLGVGKATDEATFRAEVQAIIEANYKREADYLLKIDSEKAILDAIEIELPNEFLKKWLIQVNQGKFNAEEIDRDFELVKKDLRWSLIKNKIADMTEIKVEYPEVLEKTKEMVRGQFGMYDGGMEDIIEKVANNYLTEKASPDGQDRFTQMFQAVFADKIATAITERISINHKTIDVDNFKELVAGKA